MADNDSVIQEAETVNRAVSSDDAKMLLRLEEAIRNHRTLIEKTRGELTESRGMLNDTFENDLTYKEHAEEAKKAAKVKNATKAEILKRPEVATISQKVKGLQTDLREYQNALSDYLREYLRVSGLTTFEGENGEVLEIVYVAKLKVLGKTRRG